MSAGKGRKKESGVFKFFNYHVSEDLSECSIAECKAKLKVSCVIDLLLLIAKTY